MGRARDAAIVRTPSRSGCFYNPPDHDPVDSFASCELYNKPSITWRKTSSDAIVQEAAVTTFQ
jgi:hypothetical protein